LEISAAEISHDLHYEFGVMEKCLQDFKEAVVDIETEIRRLRQALEKLERLADLAKKISELATSLRRHQ
jgi:hypothetical protein